MATAQPLDLTALEKDPRLFLYTSLTAGSSHIITATSRLETILKANKIPFQAIDMATDEKARRLWQRRAGGRKLPGLVKEGYVIGDLAEVEEWNEFGELHDNIGPVTAHGAAPPTGGQVGVQIAPVEKHANAFTPIRPAGSVVADVKGQTGVPAAKMPESGFDKTKGIALPGAAEIAALAQKKQAAKAEDTAPAAAPAATKANPAGKDIVTEAPVSPPSDLEAINVETRTTPRPRQTSISFAPEPVVPKTLLEKEKENKEKAETKGVETTTETSKPSTTKAEETIATPSPAAAVASESKPDETVAKANTTASAPKESKPEVSATAPAVALKPTETPAEPKSEPAAAGEHTLAPPTAADTSPSPASTHHRGSEVHTASPEAIAALEKATALEEAPEEDAVEDAESKVAALKIGEDVSESKADKLDEEKAETTKATEKTAEEEKKTEKDDDVVESKPTQEQDPKSAADATKSVDD